jgi:hypothetical protein
MVEVPQSKKADNPHFLGQVSASKCGDEGCFHKGYPCQVSLEWNMPERIGFPVVLRMGLVLTQFTKKTGGRTPVSHVPTLIHFCHIAASL